MLAEIEPNSVIELVEESGNVDLSDSTMGQRGIFPQTIAPWADAFKIWICHCTVSVCLRIAPGADEGGDGLEAAPLNSLA